MESKLPWDHPRMCGEEAFGGSTPVLGWGSPPHVRGRDIVVVLILMHLGITPACAGKRLELHMEQLGQWDHPRMCGEEHPHSFAQLLLLGSPPHVRGRVPAPFSPSS